MDCDVSWGGVAWRRIRRRHEDSIGEFDSPRLYILPTRALIRPERLTLGDPKWTLDRERSSNIAVKCEFSEKRYDCGRHSSQIVVGRFL